MRLSENDAVSPATSERQTLHLVKIETTPANHEGASQL